MEKQANKKKHIMTVLLTGAGGLLGTEFAKSLSRKKNIKCVCIDIDQKKLKVLSDKIKSKDFLYFRSDITSYKNLNNLKNKLVKKKIYINTIINNAALNPVPKKISKTWEDEIKVGLKGAANVIKVFSFDMIKKRRGNIINIGSDLSVIAPNQEIYKKAKLNFTKPLSYSIIKHGIVGLTKYYASLYGKFNIRCNCLSPGGINHNLDKKLVRQISSLIPLKRMANTHEYNDAILFLCSDGTKYMTGQNLVIDGGRSII